MLTLKAYPKSHECIIAVYFLNTNRKNRFSLSFLINKIEISHLYRVSAKTFKYIKIQLEQIVEEVPFSFISAVVANNEKKANNTIRSKHSTFRKLYIKVPSFT